MFRFQFINRFLFISRKPKTLKEQEEFLVGKCNKEHKEFQRILTLAHYRGYYLLKKELEQDLLNLKEYLENETNAQKFIPFSEKTQSFLYSKGILS